MQKARTSIGAIAVLSLVLGVVVFDWAIGPAESSAATPVWTPAALEALVLPAPFKCDLKCWSVGCGGSPVHQTSGGGEQGGDQHDCAGSEEGKSCLSSIHECSLPAPEAVAGIALRDPAFWHALETAPGNTLRTFLDNNQLSASFNAERQVLQVLGCSDVLIASIPLTKDQVLELTQW